MRNDILIHVRDIAEKYLIPGETQDIAMMFVPAESVYADLAEHFDDVIQKAHRARIVIVSPSLLALAIQVMQALVRDARIREEARVIQVEVQKLLEDIVAPRRPGRRSSTRISARRRTMSRRSGRRPTRSPSAARRSRRSSSRGRAGTRGEPLRLEGRSLRAVE